MNIEEFELQYRNGIDQTLNQLQTAVLLLAQLEDRITVIGQDLQNLSQTVEEFVIEQRDE
jgi:tRNA1(Val) A37 N6-methylase TrmN6